MCRQLHPDPAAATVNITVRSLTATATAANKTYDGATSAGDAGTIGSRATSRRLFHQRDVHRQERRQRQDGQRQRNFDLRRRCRQLLGKHYHHRHCQHHRAGADHQRHGRKQSVRRHNDGGGDTLGQPRGGRSPDHRLRRSVVCGYPRGYCEDSERERHHGDRDRCRQLLVQHHGYDNGEHHAIFDNHHRKFVG